MKSFPRLILGIAACASINVAASADKPPQNQTQTRGLTTAQEIAAKYDAMEQEIKGKYAKVINDAKRRIEDLELRINQLKQRIKELRESGEKAQATRTNAREGRQSRGPATEQEIEARLKAIDREINDALKAIDVAKDEIKSLHAQIIALDQKREQALQDLRKQKAKALNEAEARIR